jgi:hypothetical protein
MGMQMNDQIEINGEWIECRVETNDVSPIKAASILGTEI